MESIFSPRYTTTVDKNGAVKKTLREVPGVDLSEEFYFDLNLKLIPKKVEGSDEDYIIIPKVTYSKRSIKETIDSQADGVGLEAMLRKFAITNDPADLPKGMEEGAFFDCTKVPSDDAEYFQYIRKLQADYEALPIALRKDMTMEEFVSKVTNQEAQAFIDSQKPVEKESEDK